MTGGSREIWGNEKGLDERGVEVITFTLGGCPGCKDMKERLVAEGIPFRDINIDENDKLGDMLEREYLTDYYPIVQIVDAKTKKTYYTFVSHSRLKGFMIINWSTITELVKKLKNKLYEI